MAPASVTCPSCGRPGDGTHPTCMWCGAPLPRPRRSLGELLGGEGGDFAVQAILVANVAYYLISLMISSRTGFSGGLFGFLSPDQNSLLLLGATGTIPVLEMGNYWTLLSANYLHGGLLHILFNMMALRQIGPWVALEFGTSRMFVIYTMSGVAGYVASCLAGVPFTIGASASVCGLIGALFYFGKSRGGRYGSAVSREVGGWLVSLVLFGLVMPGINNWGHGGGVVGGIALAKLLGYGERSTEKPLHRLLAFLCATATLLVLVWASYHSLASRAG